MVQWVLLEKLDLLVNLVDKEVLEFQEQRVTPEVLVLKEAQDSKVHVENLANLACQESQEKWVHPERMVVMERKEDLVFLVLLDPQDSPDQEDSLV